jgi:predicted membrane channel-forming protein YqfA (hemolysin III family)
VKIHSHFFGGLLFCLLPLYAFHHVYHGQPDVVLADGVVFAVFFYGVAVCFLLSATYAYMIALTVSTADCRAGTTFCPTTVPVLLHWETSLITSVL